MTLRRYYNSLVREGRSHRPSLDEARLDYDRAESARRSGLVSPGARF